MGWLLRLTTIRNCRVFVGILIVIGVVFITFGVSRTFYKDNQRALSSPLSYPHSTDSSGSTRKPCADNKYRERLRALLTRWDHLALHNGIKYNIDMGSLLGQYRNKDVIPWDQDLDVLINVNDFKVIKKLSQKRNFKQGADREFHLVVQPEFETKIQYNDRQRWNCEGKKVLKQIDSCSFVKPMGRLIYDTRHLDIFHFTHIDKRLDVLGKQYNRTEYYPLVKCKFMNIETWCPNNSKKVMEKRYGDLTERMECVDGKWRRRSPK